MDDVAPGYPRIMSDTSRHPQRTLIPLTPIAALFSWLVVIAFSDRLSSTAPFDVAVLGLAYLLAACATLWALGLLGTLHRGLRVLGAVALSPLYLWHFREFARIPESKVLIPPACVITAVILYCLASLASRGVSRRRLLLGATTTFLAYLIIITASYLGSPSLRFEMMRYHTTLGYPGWAFLGPSVAQTEKMLWSENSGFRSAGDQRIPITGAKNQQSTIVFILIDTLRQDSLGAYGGDPTLMPKLNAIAHESVVFQDVLANASWTRPSIGSMFTGLYQEYHGAVGRENALSRSNETLAEILSARGYETAAFVTNWGAIGKDAGFDQGFDLFKECRASSGPYLRADQLTHSVEKWIKSRAKNQTRSKRPLFLYVHYLDPHSPYLSGGGDSNRFKVARTAYKSELSFLDEHVDRLIRSAERILEGPVTTVVASDHGEEFGEHGQKGHGFSLYQEVTRIPVLIRMPDRRAADVTERLEGRDLFDLILQAAADSLFDPSSWAVSKDRKVRFTSEYLRTDLPVYRPEYRHVCIRAIDHNGLFFVESALGPTLEIYDRNDDPGETRNLIRHHQALVPEFQHQMERLVPAPWIDRKTVRLGDDSLKQLEALGYIDLD